MALDKYSQTPASNYVSPYWVVGMAPSSVKVAGSNVMADLCVIAGVNSVATGGGTANAQTITNSNPYGAWFVGMWVVWNPNNTNTGTMTIQPDGLAAKQVNANGAAALAGQVVSGVIAVGRYDGTNVQLINPQRSKGSFTNTIATGLTTTPTYTTNYAIGIDGNTCTIWGLGVQGTSNSTGMTVSGYAPAVQTANSNTNISMWAEDNGSGVLAAVGSTNTGTWAFGKAGPNGSWTNTGTKGIQPFNTTYNLDS